MEQNRSERVPSADYECRSSFQNKAHQVLSSISDKSSQEVLSYHDETTKNYKETIKNLQRINETVAFIVEAMDDMQDGLEHKLNWLTNFVGGTGQEKGFEIF